MITHHTHLLLSIRRLGTICISFLLCLSAMAIDWHPQKCTNGKWGYTKYTVSYPVDYENNLYKWLFKPIFEEASEFNDDSIAVVKTDGRYRFMNMRGDFILPTQYKHAENFFQKTAIITDDEGASYAINYLGERISPKFLELHRYKNVFYGKKEHGKGFSLLDADFKGINSRTFHKIEVRSFPYTMSDGNPCYYLICHNADGLVSYCDALGNEIIKPKYRDIKPPYQREPEPDHYIGLYVNWKKQNKEGIHDWDYEWFKILWDPDTDMWGVIDLKDGSALVPFRQKDVNKMIRKTTPKLHKKFKLKMKSQAYRDSVFTIYGPASQQLNKVLHDNIALKKYPQKPCTLQPVMLDFACLTPDSVTGPDKRMILLRDSVQFGKPYRDIVRINNLIILTDTLGKMGVMDSKATLLPQCAYDTIMLWDDSASLARKNQTIHYVIVAKNNKYGLANIEGGMVIPIEYDMILPKISYLTKASHAMQNGLFYIINENGEVSKRGYDDVQYDNEYGTIYKVTKYGLTTTYWSKEYRSDYNGKVYKGEVPTLYEKATQEITHHSVIKDDYKVRVQLWETAALVADNNEDKGNAYNNAGVLCINNGDRPGAYYYYAKGAALGNKYSINNLSVMRRNDAGGGQNVNGWQQLADALANLANTINSARQQSQRGNHTVQATHRTSNTTNRTSSSGSSKAYYQSQYTRWENTARSAYQSATNLGIRVKSNNKDVGGTYGGKLMYWNTYKSNLTKAQREMRNIRLEAQRNGHIIPQSTYETVTLIL